VLLAMKTWPSREQPGTRSSRAPLFPHDIRHKSDHWPLVLFTALCLWKSGVRSTLLPNRWLDPCTRLVKYVLASNTSEMEAKSLYLGQARNSGHHGVRQ
jgi:hypothetical protein